MKRSILLTLVISVIAALLVLLPSTSCFAGVITVNAAADTYITEHPNLGGPSSTHGADPTLFEIGSSIFKSYPMMLFDLSGFAGKTVVGSASLTLNVVGTWSQTVSQTIEVLAVLVPWAESTVSWDSFGPGPICDTNVSCIPLDTLAVTVSPGSVVTFSGIPSALVQQWIDDPAANHGLFLLSTTSVDHEDITFASREYATASGPELTFQTTPEPTTLALLGTGVLGLAGMIRRKLML